MSSNAARFMRWIAGLLLIALLLSTGVVLFASWYMRHRSFDGPFFTEQTQGPLSLRYAGISGYELDDGETTILIDPVVTRPTVWELISGPLKPATALSRRTFPKADYILVNHAHYDHSIDTPEIAARTGAVVLGSRSVGNLLLSRGVPESQFIEVVHDQRIRLGSFDLIVQQRQHTAIMGIENPMSGTIPADAGPLWFWQYTNDGTFSFHLTSQGVSLWFMGPMETGLKADIVLPVVDRPDFAENLKQVVEASGAHTVIPNHFDNFFQPMQLGPSLLPGIPIASGKELVEITPAGARVLILQYDQSIQLGGKR